MAEGAQEQDFVHRRMPSSCSPELNPDECLDRDVNAGLAERSLPSDTKAVNAAVVERLSARKRTPEKVRNLFKKPEVCYAAADYETEPRDLPLLSLASAITLLFSDCWRALELVLAVLVRFRIARRSPFRVRAR